MTFLLDQALQDFKPQSEKEEFSLNSLLALLPDRPACLYREHFTPGHITGSGILVSADGQRVLLNHHKFLDCWLHFGGHSDGNADILDVATREVEEESGLNNFSVVNTDILSIDVHDIPENADKKEPAHKHFDVIFLFQMNQGSNEVPEISDESCALQWASWDELNQFSLEPHLLFALDKARKLIESKAAQAA